MKFVKTVALLGVGAFVVIVVIGAFVGPRPQTTAAAPRPITQASPTPTELEQAAAEAGVDSVELQGAVNATGLSPREYLRSAGEVPSPPTPTVPPAKPTPAPTPTAAFAGLVKSRVSSVGGMQTFSFEVTNDGDIDIDGLRLLANGPWDKYTVIGSTPSSKLDDGWFGNRTFQWSTKIRPGQTVGLDVVASPNEPGNHEFTFILKDGQGHALTSKSGREATIGSKISVIR